MSPRIRKAAVYMVAIKLNIFFHISFFLGTNSLACNWKAEESQTATDSEGILHTFSCSTKLPIPLKLSVRVQHSNYSWSLHPAGPHSALYRTITKIEWTTGYDFPHLKFISTLVCLHTWQTNTPRHDLWQLRNCLTPVAHSSSRAHLPTLMLAQCHLFMAPSQFHLIPLFICSSLPSHLKTLNVFFKPCALWKMQLKEN